MKISKRQMGKVRPGGVFSGKNIFEIGDDGNLISEADLKMKKYVENE